MKSFTAALTALLASSAYAFAPASTQQCSSSAVSAMPERMWDSMVDKTERSKAVPFLPRPINLDGSYVGDFGFDPFYLSSIPKNFAGFIQPPQWEDVGDGIDTLYWMREAELKHGRVCMLAWTGWLAADGAFGPVPLRFPGDIYSVESIPDSFSAHDVLVQVAKGESEREAGDYKLDPLQFLKGKSKEEVDTMKLKEIQNARLAMLAFAGVATQSALEGGNHAFPYF